MTQDSRTALVTGASGQDGILLAELLAREGFTVWALVRQGAARVELLQARVPSVKVLYGDLRDGEAVCAALRTAEPDQVYNLAAFSSVARSWEHAREVVLPRGLHHHR
jgi:GDPmannose 4,6-dehydratase